MLWPVDHLQKGIQTTEEKTTAETITKNKQNKKMGGEGEEKNGDERAMDGMGKCVQLETTAG